MANDTASKQFPKHISCLKGFVEFCVECFGGGGGVIESSEDKMVRLLLLCNRKLIGCMIDKDSDAFSSLAITASAYCHECELIREAGKAGATRTSSDSIFLMATVICHTWW